MVVSLIMSVIEMFEMCMGLVGELEVIEVPLSCGRVLTITKIPIVLHRRFSCRIFNN